jgi:hypothetical protein
MGQKYRSVVTVLVEPIGNAFFYSRDLRLRNAYEARISVLENDLLDARHARDTLQDRIDFYSGYTEAAKEGQERTGTDPQIMPHKLSSPSNLRRYLEQKHKIPRETKDGSE